MESVATKLPIQVGENYLLITYYQNQQQYTCDGKHGGALHVNNILCWYGVTVFNPRTEYGATPPSNQQYMIYLLYMTVYDIPVVLPVNI